MRRRATITIASLGALAGVFAAGGALADPGRRNRVGRSVRVWRLTARRGTHWAVVKVRGARLDAEKRAALEEQFAIRSAEDVARELGNMKGAIMKAGQLIGFIAEGLPPDAQAAFATLQADVPPMAPSLAESVIRAELGADPERLFLDWNPVPLAAASIGQVHRAVLRDGRVVAVKVQYPGVDHAIRSDLDNAELLYRFFSTFTLRGLDVKGLVDELRDRMGDELDYRLEARNQAEFAEAYRDHPFIKIPDVIAELSTTRVLTSEWVDGLTWSEFETTASDAAKQRAGEILFRFAQGSVHRLGMFNGDPHPGNYRLGRDGSMTFLDFGLVKRWTPGEWELLAPCLDAIVVTRDPNSLMRAMEASRFLPPGTGLDPQLVYDYVSSPYRPYLTDTFTFTRQFVGDALRTILDLNGPYAEVIRTLNMPASFVILDRVVWGISALLGKLSATGPWKGMLLEYHRGAPPCTELGEEDAAWRSRRLSRQRYGARG
ncbi:MAG TPA: AarF/ABC1/UbiB kinase family protein [Acidimicrobiales bacterium]|nr:AarF/ABC1/UbiB kinase family protein [Acidimicrobiales bacterium]